MRASSPVLPSEDPARVCAAIAGVVEGARPEASGGAARAVVEGAACLSRIRAAAAGRRTRAAYLRRLERNAEGGRTWIRLNKQAAFVGVPALCDAGESPLGEILLEISSPRLAEVVEWLAGPPAQKS